MDDYLFGISLDDYSEKYLLGMGLNFNDVLIDENPELRLIPAEGFAHTRDIPTIITATAALSPMVVPIIKELISRLIPHVETTVTTTVSRGKTVTKVQIRQS